MPGKPSSATKRRNPDQPIQIQARSHQIKTRTQGTREPAEGLSHAFPRPEPQQHDTLGTLRFDAWDGAFRPGVRRPILARLRRALAACMDARAVGLGSMDFVAKPMHSVLSMDSRCRGNAPRRPHPVRAAAVTGGRCPRLRAFASGGLSGDCSGRAAGGTTLPPAPCASGRVGAMGRRGDMLAGAAGFDAVKACSPTATWRSARHAR